MKKLVLGLVFGILLIGLIGVFAEENNTENQTNNIQTDNNITCTDTCSSLNYTCGTQIICNNSVNCGICDEDEVCQNATCVEKENNETEENETEEKPACSELTKIKQCIARKDCRYVSAEQRCEDNPNYNLTRKIHKLKERLQDYLNSSECPENCNCVGSTIKCETEGGRVMTVVAGKSGNIIIQTKGVNASTTVILIKNQTGVFGNFSGKFRKLKFMPDEIKEKVLKKLKMRNCTNCSIELKEDGTYEMNVENKYRILGIFPKKIVIITKVDSETGEMIVIKRPWWRFLAFKSKE